MDFKTSEGILSDPGALRFFNALAAGRRSSAVKAGDSSQLGWTHFGEHSVKKTCVVHV